MNGYGIGDLVRYAKPIRFLPSPLEELVGIIIEIEGPKWYKVQWSDKVIYTEHVGDLELVSRSR